MQLFGIIPNEIRNYLDNQFTNSNTDQEILNEIIESDTFKNQQE